MAEQLRTISSQVKSIWEDNRKLIILVVCLALLWWVWTNCKCENLAPDLRKRAKALVGWNGAEAEAKAKAEEESKQEAPSDQV
ncbi:MAG: hypothetical protein A3F91_00535 [Flavobacteria bacterium RIFCSPLOWO2_12_FULL_35_11]|nr:MAG: hypothetical protein A3F91_00535 [Flavobacteria bacterium RIFCSPLOWO2_12_FULL_35_11]